MRGLAAFLGVLAFCSCALPQGGGWAAVEGIPPGSQVEVRLAPPKTVEGMLVSVSASGMDVQKSDGSIRHVPRPRVAKVYLVGKAHKLLGGLIGATAGGAAGAVYGYGRLPRYSDSPTGPVPNDRAGSAAYFGALAAAVGAVVGAIIGSHHAKTLVYRSEPGSGGGPPNGQRQAHSQRRLAQPDRL